MIRYNKCVRDQCEIHLKKYDHITLYIVWVRGNFLDIPVTFILTFTSISYNDMTNITKEDIKIHCMTRVLIWLLI